MLFHESGSVHVIPDVDSAYHQLAKQTELLIKQESPTS